MTSTQNQINFKAIQQINIKRFKAFDNNNLITISEINQLANLATQKYPSSGYARSLYRLLSGVRLPVEVPNYDTILDGKVRSPEKSEELSINIYPNPFTDILTIDLNGNDITEVEVLSLDKKQVLTTHVTEPTIVINLSELKVGLYILRIKKSIGTFIDRKIIKI